MRPGVDRLIEDTSTDPDRLVDHRPVKGIQITKIEAPEDGTPSQLLASELRRILYALDPQAAAALRNSDSVFKVEIGEVEVGLEPGPGHAEAGRRACSAA